MTTKKIVVTVVSILAALVLLVVLFVGGVAGFIFYSIGHSEPAMTAKEYLRTNETLKRDIGDVNGFGSLVTGSINHRNGNGEATLQLKVIGERRTVNATVDLAYRSNRAWRVTGASYTSDGQVTELMQGYESPTPDYENRFSP